jgi:hypothetical protein
MICLPGGGPAQPPHPGRQILNAWPELSADAADSVILDGGGAGALAGGYVSLADRICSGCLWWAGENPDVLGREYGVEGASELPCADQR